jgi:hypothetical protein
LIYVVQAATLLILVFAANTSFAGFPRLAAILSRDGFLPAFFAYRGERLAFSTGILTLGGLGALLVWVFQGSVVALINLYAVGVFTAFTLSQSGMVLHWLRLRRSEGGWLRRLVVNALGAAATAVVTGVIAFTKFDRGAWVIVLLIPLLVLGFLAIHRYYARPRILQPLTSPPPAADVAIVPLLSHEDLPDEEQLRRAALQRRGVDPSEEDESLEREPPPADARERQGELARHLAWLEVVERELALALSVAPNVELIRVVHDAAEAETFRAAWDHVLATQAPVATVATVATRLPGPTPGRTVRVEALISPYRTTARPLANFIRWRAETDLADKRIVVLLPRERRAAWWEWPLRLRVAHRLTRRLRGAASNVSTLDVPYTLGVR